MLVPFDMLAGDSRIWVYQADRKMTPAEEKWVAETLGAFCEQWVAHGAPLRTSFRIEYSRFVILSVDQKVHDASGCSIDGSVRTLKSIEQQLNLAFFDRTRVAFMLAGEVRLIALKDLKEAFADGIINSETLTFNPQVSSKSDLDKTWIMPAGKTWLVRYLTPTTVD